jgi:hypothetical protein
LDGSIAATTQTLPYEKLLWDGLGTALEIALSSRLDAADCRFVFSCRSFSFCFRGLVREARRAFPIFLG